MQGRKAAMGGRGTPRIQQEYHGGHRAGEQGEQGRNAAGSFLGCWWTRAGFGSALILMLPFSLAFPNEHAVPPFCSNFRGFSLV